jgi:twinkle protein
MNEEPDRSQCVGHEPCPKCHSTDNLGRFSDGHGYCFGCKYYEPGEGELTSSPRPRNTSDRFNPLHYTISAIPRRGLSEETCRFWDYGTGEFKDEPVHIANFRDPTSRELMSQKVRNAAKDFAILGEKKLPLYGQWLWRGDRRSLIITEGELDALSVSQAQNNKYPVVSLPNGAHSALKAVKDNYEWICEFEKVVLMFDQDKPGREAAEECAEILPVGKVFVADLGEFKDANEALVAGRVGAITSAFWNAKPYQPDGVYTLSDIREQVLAPVALGRPWFLPALTKLTYGRRDGEVYYIGAGTGIGKTDWFTQSIAFDVLELGIPTAVIYLEQPPQETGKRICGKVAGKAFHVPMEEAGWTQEELDATFSRLEATGKLFLGGNFSSASWDQIKSRIRYMVHALGVKHLYLDHLTALADPSNERESLEIITKEMALLCQELGITAHVISHLATPDGKPHEEGGRVMLRHFKGSRAIGYWAHFAFGLERNPQDEDPQLSQQTTFRILKDRYTGRATGKTLCLDYDTDTGLIREGRFGDPKCEFPDNAALDV